MMAKERRRTVWCIGWCDQRQVLNLKDTCFIVQNIWFRERWSSECCIRHASMRPWCVGVILQAWALCLKFEKTHWNMCLWGVFSDLDKQCVTYSTSCHCHDGSSFAGSIRWCSRRGTPIFLLSFLTCSEKGSLTLGRLWETGTGHAVYICVVKVLSVQIYFQEICEGECAHCRGSDHSFDST